MERYLAIDNVCAWPNLTKMPDGAVAAVIFNQPTHGGWEGDVECWASEDEGLTWALRGVPGAHEPGTNRMNVAAGLARDGSLVVLVTGWSRRGPVGEYSSPHDGEILPIWTCRSNDGGRTWDRSKSGLPLPKGPTRIVPFGDIVRQTDGTLGVCIYGGTSDGRSAHFYSSSDDGLTWTVRGTIRESDATETTPLALPDGRLLAVARTQFDQHLEIYESADQGGTWANRGPVTLAMQHPGNLLALEDGRLLLTYGIRNKGLYGIGARISNDEGQTWGAPELLVDLENAADGGYPSSVQAKDGPVITAYYCAGVPAHQRYHMGVIRWLPDK